MSVRFEVAVETPHCRDEAIRFTPLTVLLRQLDDLLAEVSDEQYVQRPVGTISGSLGGHIRHCLDHVTALLTGIDSGEIDYDQRDRGTPVETERTAARELIDRLCEVLSSTDETLADSPVTVTALLTADDNPVRIRSTIGRELVFVLSHTIHHNALIAAICRTLGIPMPDRFGYAPATVAHLNETACVR